MRATTSVPPPAAKGTTRVIGCVGQVCALAIRDTAGSAAAPAARCRKFRRGSFIMLLPSNAKREPDLFSLDIRGLEDRPPFFDLGLLLRGKRFRRLLFASWNILALIGKQLPHGCISQSILHRRIE